MVSISRELPVETERRLQAVVRAAQVRHLDGEWRFVRTGHAAPAEAVAAVRDVDGWCALVPAAPQENGERFGLTVTTFSPSIENSGFVGWLASAVKQRLGSGVFVICGDNPGRGGIFDYLGYPIEIAADVRALIAELQGRSEPPADSLDLRVFAVVETSPASAISGDTRFEFRERAGVVTASYAGGAVHAGFLTGRRQGARVTAAYAQLHADGRVASGAGELLLEETAAGLRLTEEYQWSDGRRGRNVLESVASAAHG